VASRGPEILSLTKHEAVGNDFLVVVDVTECLRLEAAEVRSLCDRHRGVGADGVIVVSPGGARADLAMELRNADGGAAETSGNGLRCAAQAAVEARLVQPPRFTVATGAGVSLVSFEGRGASGRATVELGPVRLVGAPITDPQGRTAQVVDVGNPHLVVRCDDPDQIELAAMAAELAARFDNGINVEYVAPSGHGALRLRVWERGVGETLACGSGSCAAAAAARAWGLVGDTVSVHNPGGVLEVFLGAGEADGAVLGGPVRRVARVTVERGALK